MDSNNCGMLFCFIGIDGTGKTTNAKNLVNYLEKKGYPAKYVYGRLEPLLLRPFIYLGRRFIIKGINPSEYSDYTKKRQSAILKYTALSKIYLNILLFDTYLQLFYKVTIPKIRGYILISDRYIQDTVITDLSRFLGYDSELTRDYINKIQKKVPLPDLIFHLSVPPIICIRRKADVPCIEYLENLFDLYNNICDKEENIVKIDGTRPFDQILKITSEKCCKIIQRKL